MRNERFLLAYLIISGIVTAGVRSCSLAEEGKPYELNTSTTLPESVQNVFWFKDDDLLAECSIVSKVCVIIDLRLQQAKIERKNSRIEFSANIANVSRHNANNARGSWILATDKSSPRSQPLYYCLLGVYAMPEQIKCEATWSVDETVLTCNINRIYPEASVMIYGLTKPASFSSCENTIIQGDPIYYKAECSVKFSTRILHWDRNDIYLFIYPNINGDLNSKKIGINVSITVALESAVAKICFGNENYCSCQGSTSLQSKPLDHRYRDLSSINRQNGILTCNNTDYLIKNDIICDFKLMPALIIIAIIAVLFLIAILFLLIKLKIKGKRCGRFYACFKKPRPQSVEIELNDHLINETNSQSHEKKKCQNPFNISNVENKFETVPIILLMGTKNSHKHIIGKKLLQKKDKDERETDNNDVQLDFSHLGSRDIKIVDVPNFNPKDTTTYQENLKSSLCLSPDGYSIFIIVSTIEDVKDTLLMIYMLADEFGKDVINYILVFVMTTKDPEFIYKTNVEPLEELLDTRCLLYNFEASPDIDKTVFGLIDDWSYNYVNYHFKTAHEKNKAEENILFEKIFKSISLLLQRVKNEETFWEDENNLKETKQLQNKCGDWRKIMNLSQSTDDDLQGILDYFTQGFSKPAVSDKESQKPLQMAEQSLHSLRFELVKCLLSERQPLIRKSLKWEDIVKKCKRK